MKQNRKIRINNLSNNSNNSQLMLNPHRKNAPLKQYSELFDSITRPEEITSLLACISTFMIILGVVFSWNGEMLGIQWKVGIVGVHWVSKCWSPPKCIKWGFCLCLPQFAVPWGTVKALEAGANPKQRQHFVETLGEVFLFRRCLLRFIKMPYTSNHQETWCFMKYIKM